MPTDTPPIPPAVLRERVTSSTDANVFHETGLQTLDEWSRALAAVKADLEATTTMMDFGCGAGRVLRHLASRKRRGQRLIGADVDEMAIDWVRQNLSEAEAVLLPAMPPSTLDSDTIDLILSHSVFTHLPEDVQLAWINELHRCLRPQGILLTSIHGRAASHNHFLEMVGALQFERAEEFLRQLSSLGFFYKKILTTVSEGELPDYYGAAFHRLHYIEDRWVPGRFELLAYLPGASLKFQDIVILRKL